MHHLHPAQVCGVSCRIPSRGCRQERYGPEHPKRQTAEAEVRAARENTKRQIDTITTSITKEYELVAGPGRAPSRRALAQSKGDILGMNRKEYELGVHEREVASNKSLYEMFTSRMKETNVAGDLQSPIARVVDPAVVKDAGPYSPRKFRIIGIAAVVGLILGLMLALLLEYLDNTIKNAEDVDAKLQPSAVGPVAAPQGKDRNGRPANRLHQGQGSGILRGNPLHTHWRAALVDRLAAQGAAGDLIRCPARARPRWPRTSHWHSGQVRKVCLIDADMRRPTVAKVLGVDTTSKGLSNLVSGSDPTSECLHFNKELGIHVIPIRRRAAESAGAAVVRYVSPRP
jgi:succinoglycan biosynthesis transport protein ExoP